MVPPRTLHCHSIYDVALRVDLIIKFDAAPKFGLTPECGPSTYAANCGGARIIIVLGTAPRLLRTYIGQHSKRQTPDPTMETYRRMFIAAI